MEIIKYINENMVLPSLECKTKEELFKAIHNIGIENGYIKEEFYEKILQREQNFPTGLNLGEIGVAIPHTDAEYIKEEFIAVCQLKNEVEFKSMEDADESVNVKLAFVLGLNKPHSQLTILQELMQLIQNKETVNALINANDKEDILKIIESL